MTDNIMNRSELQDQLMEDIDCIVDNHLNEKLTPQEQLSLVMDLCDAVCRNFPTN